MSRLVYLPYYNVIIKSLSRMIFIITEETV